MDYKSSFNMMVVPICCHSGKEKRKLPPTSRCFVSDCFSAPRLLKNKKVKKAAATSFERERKHQRVTAFWKVLVFWWKQAYSCLFTRRVETLIVACCTWQILHITHTLGDICGQTLPEQEEPAGAENSAMQIAKPSPLPYIKMLQRIS